MQWKILKHLPYFPDLALSDFHAFPSLKGDSGGKQFEMEEELNSAGESIFPEIGG